MSPCGARARSNCCTAALAPAVIQVIRVVGFIRVIRVSGVMRLIRHFGSSCVTVFCMAASIRIVSKLNLLSIYFRVVRGIRVRRVGSE